MHELPEDYVDVELYGDIDPAVPQAQRRVLVVDDDRMTRELLSRYLNNAGYEVTVVDNAESAWHVLCHEGTDLVITDWMMPGTDGLELCRRVRAHKELGFFYIIMLTAQDESDKVVVALDVGADDYVVKPFKRDELLARVRVGMRFVNMRSELTRRTGDAYRSNAQIANLNIQLSRQAFTDELTGLLNRRETLKRFGEHWAHAVNTRGTLSCIMMDIDHFKRVNDTHGHDAGDQVLVSTARLLQQSCRTSDILGRLGGEEFVLVCPQTNLEQATGLAERIRTSAEQAAIPVRSATLHITMSLGVAERGPNMRSWEDLLRVADQTLYEAKASGRNRVCTAAAQQSVTVVEDSAGIEVDE